MSKLYIGSIFDKEFIKVSGLYKLFFFRGDVMVDKGLIYKMIWLNMELF